MFLLVYQKFLWMYVKILIGTRLLYMTFFITISDSLLQNSGCFHFLNIMFTCLSPVLFTSKISHRKIWKEVDTNCYWFKCLMTFSWNGSIHNVISWLKVIILYLWNTIFVSLIWLEVHTKCTRKYKTCTQRFVKF